MKKHLEEIICVSRNSALCGGVGCVSSCRAVLTFRRFRIPGKTGVRSLLGNNLAGRCIAERVGPFHPGRFLDAVCMYAGRKLAYKC